MPFFLIFLISPQEVKLQTLDDIKIGFMSSSVPLALLTFVQVILTILQV